MNKNLIALTILTVAFGLGFGLLIKKPSPIKAPKTKPKTQPITDENDKKEQKKPEDNLPKVAIIIDDIGNDFEIEKEISKIKADITLAVLPFKKDTQKAVSYFQARELILHLPLEPMNKKQVEDKMLKISMSEREIKSKFDKYFSSLKTDLAGINNHKGSRFTSDTESMEYLLDKIKGKKQNLYFLDSYTINSSVAFNLAQKMEIPTARRDVFLDNSKKKQDIKTQLKKLINIAKNEGSAIWIGHGYQETISVLIKKIPKLKKEVGFVTASQIVK